MIIYRPATALDLPTFVSLDTELFPYSPWSIQQYREEFAQETRHFVVAESEVQAIIGYAGVFAPGTGVAADILTLGVIAQHRRQGIARTLMALLTEWAGVRDACAMILEVKTENFEAIGLYETLGYEKLNVRRDYFGSGLDALVMRKDLT